MKEFKSKGMIVIGTTVYKLIEPTMIEVCGSCGVIGASTHKNKLTKCCDDNLVMSEL